MKKFLVSEFLQERPQSGRRWLSTEDVLLRKLWVNESIPLKRVAELLGRTEAAIGSRVADLDLPRRVGGSSKQGSAHGYRITLPMVSGVDNDKYNYRELKYERVGSSKVVVKLRQERERRKSLGRQIRAERARDRAGKSRGSLRTG